VISTPSSSPGQVWPVWDDSVTSPRRWSRSRWSRPRLRERWRWNAAGDTALAALLAELDDFDTRAAVTAERVLLADLEAGCSAPVGAIAEVVESIDDDGRVFEELSLRACVAAADGSDVIRASGIGTPGRAAELGLAVAAELLELGAREVMSTERE
jgi:hydroxymethylbilane synthase